MHSLQGKAVNEAFSDKKVTGFLVFTDFIRKNSHFNIQSVLRTVKLRGSAML